MAGSVLALRTQHAKLLHTELDYLSCRDAAARGGARQSSHFSFRQHRPLPRLVPRVNPRGDQAITMGLGLPVSTVPAGSMRRSVR
jgi:hypothetical protein